MNGINSSHQFSMKATGAMAPACRLPGIGRGDGDEVSRSTESLVTMSVLFNFREFAGQQTAEIFSGTNAAILGILKRDAMADMVKGRRN